MRAGRDFTGGGKVPLNQFPQRKLWKSFQCGLITQRSQRAEGKCKNLSKPEEFCLRANWFFSYFWAWSLVCGEYICIVTTAYKIKMFP